MGKPSESVSMILHSSTRDGKNDIYWIGEVNRLNVERLREGPEECKGGASVFRSFVYRVFKNPEQIERKHAENEIVSGVLKISYPICCFEPV